MEENLVFRRVFHVTVLRQKLQDEFVSNGGMVSFPNLGVAIAGPEGWSVRQNSGSGPSLVMKEPKDQREASRKDPSTLAPRFQRNITVSVIHEPSVIDEARAKEITTELSQSYGEHAIAKNFQVTESRLFNYRGENDGILMYSAMTIKDIEMMQMHILVSNSGQQFLLSYTDMASRFDPNDPGFLAAWTSINSIEIGSPAPTALDQYMQPLALAGILLGSFLFVIFMARRKRQSNGTDTDFGSTLGSWSDDQGWDDQGSEENYMARPNQKLAASGDTVWDF